MNIKKISPVSFSCLNIGYIGNPSFVHAARAKLSSQEIFLQHAYYADY